NSAVRVALCCSATKSKEKALVSPIWVPMKVPATCSALISTWVKVVKNKLAPPFKVVDFDIMYGEGVSKSGELIDLGVKAGVVEKSGAWFSYNSTRIGQGRENAKQFMRDNPAMAAEIENTIRANAGLVADALSGAPGDLDGNTVEE
ncbi:MAG: hypothetical protein HQL42_03735, partial [Alphaproteobacteria bacterium]|nr:hypothetical protein [Alphaproteobacteria bacterium]